MQRQMAASAVYRPAAPNTLQDEPVTDHYRSWGYSIGYEVGADGQPVPEGGNTAVFRIFPHSMTEPVFVTKPEQAATFTVNVLSGEGELIRAKADGEVEELPLSKGSQVVIRPGEAYAYKNTDQTEDLVLHDVALPAFKEGDDMELTSSYRPERAPQPKEGYLSCTAKTPEGRMVMVDVPEKFYELVGQALLPQEKVSVAELDTDIKYGVAFAVGGLAMFGAGLYGNYSAITGKRNGFELLSWPTGATSLGGLTAAGSIKQTVSLLRKRAALKRAARFDS